MKKILIPLIIFVLIATEVLVFSRQNLRQPSSVTTASGDIVQLVDNDLSNGANKKQIKRSLLHSLDWNFSIEKTQLELKFENLKLLTGTETSDLCASFSMVTVTLEAPNVTYSGEHPEISVTKPCESFGDISPFEFDLNLLNDMSALKVAKEESKSVNSNIRLAHFEDETPGKWRVKQLIFHSASKIQSQNFEITKYEILSVLGYSIEFQTTPKKQ